MKKILLFLGGAMVLLLFSGCSSGLQERQGVAKQEAPGRQPGLAVIYIFQKYRSVDQVPVGIEALRMGRRGKPVLLLDHMSGKEGYVFDSGRSQGVAMVMDGFLQLERPGTYRWQAMANDGIRMLINKTMIFEDPKVHKDRLTPVGQLYIDRPGKYPVQITYFQRKGTARLQLYWQPPGAEKFSLVPAEVYWH